jgi:hypothetical protein
MIFSRSATLLLLLLGPILPAPAEPATAPITVTVEGAVQSAGQFNLPEGAGLSQAVLAARPMPSAYPLGAALLRQSALSEQVRLKAGLLYDLQALQGSNNADIASTASSMAQWLTSVPLTGRVVQQLEPRLLEINAALNRPVTSGDRVIYPTRPEHIQVVGTVKAPCQLPHIPLQDAKAYLSACPRSATADRDLLYVIQPDGQVQELGIAAWNRSSPQPLAPGAVVYVPVAQRALRDVDPDFNRLLADFLATQLLPAPGVTP